MAKRPNSNMSLAIDAEFQEKLKKVALKREISVSKLIRDVMEKYLPSGDDEVDTIIFKVPSSAKSSKEDLKNWFMVRVNAIVNKLSS
jgi:hypothetical protein